MKIAFFSSRPGDRQKLSAGGLNGLCVGVASPARARLRTTTALGHNRKCHRFFGRSVLPSTAVIVASPRHVRFVPNSEVAVSFEYLVGASEQRWRHSEPKCIGGSQIDGEFELGGLFNGKF